MDKVSGIFFFNIIKTIDKNRRRGQQRYKRSKIACFRELIKNQQKVQQQVIELIKFIKPRERNIWMRERSDAAWQQLKDGDENRWKEAFRISKAAFNYLCIELDPILRPKDNPISTRVGIPTDKKIALTLYKLASCCEYRVVGDVFGVSKCTVHNVFYKVLKALIHKFSKSIIRFPTTEEAQLISDAFENRCGLPMIVGCIDGSHIPILAPAEGHSDFLNRKGWTSIILQGVVDHKYRFIDVSVKYPGRCHDSLAFKGSGIYKNKSKIFPNLTKNVNGRDVPLYLIGDPAYPLLDWVMKDYPGRGLAEDKENFNKSLNRARVNVEIAFGRLKARFRLLSKRVYVDYRFIPLLVTACCILHNILEDFNDPVPQQWMNDLHTLTNTQYPPVNVVNHDRNSLDGTNLRDHLCTFLNTQLQSN